jgi:hypothetical protein
VATTYTVTTSFTADTTAVASEVNQNFTDVLTALNSFDASNLGSGAVPLARISGLTSSQCASAFFKDEDDMASDSATAVSSQQAIKAHVTTQIAAAVPDDDAFGTWASKANNTNYLAASDGIVCAWRNEGTSDTSQGLTDGSNPPTTVRIQDTGSKASITFPVKKGNYWKVTNISTVYWLPIGA